MTKYLEEDVEFEKWSRAHFQGNMYEVMTTNIVETVNNMMKVAIEYPITASVDFVLYMMGQWFFERRRDSLNMIGKIISKREALIKNRWDNTGSLKSRQLNENEYHVVCEDLNTIINLRSKRCKYKVFEVVKLSCIRTIAAAGQFQPISTGEV